MRPLIYFPIMDRLSQSPQFKPFMKKLALMAAVCTLGGLLLKLFVMPGGAPLLTMGCGTLAVVAFMLGWLFPYPYSTEDEDYFKGLMPIWNFSMTCTGFALSMGLMGLLFLLMHWPGGRQLLLLTAITLAACGIAWLYYFHLKKKSNNQLLK